MRSSPSAILRVGRSVLQRIEEEPESVPGLFLTNPQQFREHAILERHVVDTNAAATNLPSVQHDDHTPRARTLPGSLSSSGKSSSIGAVNGCIHGVLTPVLRMPFEQREFHNPGKFPGIGASQIFPFGKIQPKLPQTHRRRIRRAGCQQQEILMTGTATARGAREAFLPKSPLPS